MTPSNPALQELRRLSRRRSARSESGTYLVDGPVLLAEALRAGVALRSVFAEPAGLSLASVRSARDAGVAVHPVQEGALARVLDVVNPQSVVAVAERRADSVDDVVQRAVATRRAVLVLVELQDPGNAGTLLRVAEAAGCAGVVLTERCVDAHNPKTVRASAGALFRLPVAEGAGLSALLDAASAAGLESWATVRDGGTPIDECDLTGAGLLLIGSEANGLPDDVCRAATHRLSIPMEGDVESLNAAVAGALVVFEAARPRRAAPVAGVARSAAAEHVGGTTSPVGHDVSAPAAGGASTWEERSK